MNRISDDFKPTASRRKNAPMEMSSKKPNMQRFPSGSTTVKRQRYRDPRFDERCGQFSANSFEDNYKFVYDLRRKEMDMVKKQLKMEMDPEARDKLQNLLGRQENQERSKMQKKKGNVKEMERKELNKKRLNEGKKPFFMKKSDKSLLDMVAQFEDLKKKGKLKSYMEKKRKKNAHSESKLLVQKHVSP
ncbi:ribosomal RNA processing protein 36 homolog [Paramacrobiotus metropolitanus]|uniref:ribosomal RNA processing protein 36 homolog n=1 Tax=Paramacrobiotus metropolitanus TaxID=2943436 RepID=UPI002445885A|nr:ribosomal RNA processing protein 36 homolog [Paramacrobiotus metropolitanus]